MTTDVRTLTFRSDTDANFRAWGSGLASALLACGLSRTTDTGQIDWTTVTRNTASSVEANNGFEIFRFTDALQATRPLFVKLEYGHHNSANSVVDGRPYGPVVYMTVGTGTNGAGTLTGLVVERRKLLGGNSVGGYGSAGAPTQMGSAPVWTSGDSSSIQMCIGPTSTAQPQGVHGNGQAIYASLPCLWSVERTRDIAGNPIGNGAAVMSSCWRPNDFTMINPATAPQTTFQMISWDIGVTSQVESAWPIAWPGSMWSTGASEGDVSLFPLRYATPRIGYGLSWMGSYKGEFTQGVTLAVQHLGPSNRTYIALTQTAGTANNDAARTYTNSLLTTGGLFMRWE